MYHWRIWLQRGGYPCGHLEEGVEVESVPLLFPLRPLCSVQEDRLAASQLDSQSEDVSTDLGFIIRDDEQVGELRDSRRALGNVDFWRLFTQA